MSIEDKLREYMQEAEIPNDLLPENIVTLLGGKKTKVKQTESDSPELPKTAALSDTHDFNNIIGININEQTSKLIEKETTIPETLIFTNPFYNSDEDDNDDDVIKPIIKEKKRRKKNNAAMRIISSLAACAVLVFGLYTSVGNDLFSSKPDVSPEPVVVTAEDYSTLYNKIVNMMSTQSREKLIDGAPGLAINGATGGEMMEGGAMDDVAVEEEADMAEAPAAIAETATTASGDYSDTNNQVAGVNEGDIIKTDGKNIYHISSNTSTVNVIETNSGEMEIIASIYKENAYPLEMLLYNDKLVVIYNQYEYKEIYPDEPYDLGGTSASGGSVGASTPGYNPDDVVEVDEEEDVFGEDVFDGDVSSQIGAGADGTSASPEYIEPYEVAADELTADIYDEPAEKPLEKPNEELDKVPEGTEIYYSMPYTISNNNVYVEVYYTGDFNVPLATYSQNGYYNTIRMIDNNIYLVTQYSPYFYASTFAETQLDMYVPCYTINGSEYYIQPVDISVPDTFDSVTYTVVSGLDVDSGEFLKSTKACLGYAGTVYVSPENVYTTATVYNYNYDDNNSRLLIAPSSSYSTGITKFSIDGGNVEYVANGSVDGSILNQFSMDEYQGNLRIGTTTSTWDENGSRSYSTLYILDGELNEISKIENIGEGEFIKSVRFENEIGYVVTYRQTDPLFKFDLSDPANPVSLGELKVEGYSTYMQTWDDGLLLGIGVDSDSEGIRTGLKISMFEVSDGNNMQEIDKFPIRAESSDDFSWVYSPAEYDHKSILVSPEKNLIAFPYQYYDGISNVSLYALYSYDKEVGFMERGTIRIYDYDSFYRGLYIDDVIFAFAYNSIISASIDDATVIDTIELYSYKEYYYDLPTPEVEPAEPREEEVAEDLTDD